MGFTIMETLTVWAVSMGTTASIMVCIGAVVVGR